jgi:protein-S-isoprenylcysteine O-methyltransferase Ste14
MAVLPLVWYTASWVARSGFRPLLEIPDGVAWPRLGAAAGLVLAGAVLYARSIRALAAARGRGELATSGPFGRCRHPMYAAWLFWLVPGLALLSGSWPDLALPIVFYASFTWVIGREERRLRERFSEYAGYATRTPRLCAWPW